MIFSLTPPPVFLLLVYWNGGICVSGVGFFTSSRLSADTILYQQPNATNNPGECHSASNGRWPIIYRVTDSFSTSRYSNLTNIGIMCTFEWLRVGCRSFSQNRVHKFESNATISLYNHIIVFGLSLFNSSPWKWSVDVEIIIIDNCFEPVVLLSIHILGMEINES